MQQIEVATIVAQFGMAGMIAWMWLTERRAATARERQIEDAHRRLSAERESAAALFALVEANTRALTLLEASQREIAGLLRALVPSRGPAREQARGSADEPLEAERV
ncbi:MAG: hypothetical protein AAFX79_09030 [Planctomycetota bacterium]